MGEVEDLKGENRRVALVYCSIMGFGVVGER